LISLYFVITNTMNDEYGGYVQAKPMFSYYLYIIACVIGAVVGIMIIKEYQKKITANAGTVQHVEKPNVWVKTALYTVGETFAIYVLFFLLSATF
jgi:Mn2+/Fe2+ NRAMP family transporter